jgi:phosphatidylglycerol---prolipoprotein diacylglyceryl transferase
MLPVLQIGPVAIQVPGLVLLAGLWLGLLLSERAASRSGISSNTLYSLVFISFFSAIIGARLTYVVQYPSAFAASPSNLFSLNPGLLDVYGGLAIGFITALLFGSRKRLQFWPTLDALTPTFATLGIAYGLANLASGNAFGIPTNLPWGIELWGCRRHPTQIYETVLASIILTAVLYYNRQDINKFPGTVFLVFLVMSSAGRLFLEGFRGDSNLIGENLRAAQIFAWFILALSLVALGIIKGKTCNTKQSWV